MGHCADHRGGFVRKVVKRAYKIGAMEVYVEWSDEEITKTRMELAPEEGLADFPVWRVNGRIAMAEEGAAFLWVVADNPDLLKGVDSARIAIANKAQQAAFMPFRHYIFSKVAWSIVAVPSEAWADMVFPEVETNARIDTLWEAIFSATRVYEVDPVEKWREHAASLQAKAAWLNERLFSAIRYKAPGTDLTIGLPEGHIWTSA
jgi:aminopeptidase